MSSSRRLLALVAALLLCASGCAATPSDAQTESSAPRAMRHGSSGSASLDDSRGPSAAARMICGSEIREAVRVAFGLSTPPRSRDTWSRRLFTCSYLLRGGTLLLSVDDSLDQKSGRAYYSGLQSRLAGAQAIGAADSFGLPGFATPDGNVVFIKDGKTLRVDASGLPDALLPSGATQTDAAYAIAAAVVGCWTE